MVVDELQRGADALVVEAHLDLVLLAVARREVVGVRVEGAGVAVEVGLEDLLGLDLVDALEHPLVARAQRVAGLGPGLAGERQRQRVVLDALAPDLVQLLLGDGPGRALAVELVGLLHREVGLLLEQRERMLHPLAVALLVAREHGVGGLAVAGADHVVEAHAPLVELGDVAGEEVGALAVHRLEELVHHARRHRIVDADATVVRVLQDAADLPRDHPFAVARHDRSRRYG